MVNNIINKKFQEKIRLEIRNLQIKTANKMIEQVFFINNLFLNFLFYNF